MISDYIFFFLLTALSLLNLVVLFFISAFLVRLRRDLAEFLSLYLDSLSEENPPEPTEKTWDQKYEDELESVSRRLRQSASGEL